MLEDCHLTVGFSEEDSDGILPTLDSKLHLMGVISFRRNVERLVYVHGTSDGLEIEVIG